MDTNEDLSKLLELLATARWIERSQQRGPDAKIIFTPLGEKRLLELADICEDFVKLQTELKVSPALVPLLLAFAAQWKADTSRAS